MSGISGPAHKTRKLLLRCSNQLSHLLVLLYYSQLVRHWALHYQTGSEKYNSDIMRFSVSKQARSKLQNPNYSKNKHHTKSGWMESSNKCFQWHKNFLKFHFLEEFNQPPYSDGNYLISSRDMKTSNCPTLIINIWCVFMIGQRCCTVWSTSMANLTSRMKYTFKTCIHLWIVKVSKKALAGLVQPLIW